VVESLHKKENDELLIIKYNTFDKANKNNLYLMKRLEVKTEEDKNKFVDQIKILNKIKCNYIIKIYDFFFEHINEKEFLCIILEYIEENNNIKNKLIENFFNSRNVWKFFVEIVIGLKALNDNNILIDNLNPENIYLDKYNNFKIGGIGKLLDINKEKEIGIIDDIWKYQSPEILNGEKNDETSSIWSLGCILYEIAFKKAAFNSKKNIQDIIYNIPEDSDPDLSILLKNLICKKVNRKNIKDLMFDQIFKKKLVEMNLFNENIPHDMKSKF
jgi:NIMA (never in mitosis gene a)-related kinase